MQEGGGRRGAAEEISRKVRKVRKVLIDVTLAAEAFINLLNAKSHSAPLVRGRLRPPKPLCPAEKSLSLPTPLLGRGRSPPKKASRKVREVRNVLNDVTLAAEASKNLLRRKDAPTCGFADILSAKANSSRR